MTDLMKNSCLICLVKKQNDFDRIIETQSSIETNSYDLNKTYKTELCLIYEDLFNLEVLDDKHFPAYMCPYCTLQLKLLSKFKMKATKSYKTIIKELQINELVETDSQIDTEDLNIHNEESNSSIHENDNNQFALDSNQILNNDYVVSDSPDELTTDDLDNTDNQYVVLEEVDYCDNRVLSIKTNKESSDYECLSVQFLASDCNRDEINNYDEIDEIDTKDEINDNITILSAGEEDEEITASSIKSKDKTITKQKVEKYQCNSCHLVFEQKSRLVNHRKEKHPIYPCEICGKKLLSEDGHSSHIKQHLGLPGYKCEECGKTFNQKQHLIYHTQNYHSHERNFECMLCTKKFLTVSDLKIHMRVHNDERRYACDICDKRFRAYTHMKNHRYMHFEKSIVCPHCNFKYASPSTLRTHIRSVHFGICPYECEICHKKFKRKHHLINHMQTHAKNEKPQEDDINESIIMNEIDEPQDNTIWTEDDLSME